MRSFVTGLIAIVLCGITALVLTAAATERAGGVDLGIPADEPITQLERGQTACEGPISLDRSVRLIEFTPAPGGKPGPQMRLTMRDFDSRRILASADLAAQVLTGLPRPVRIRSAGGGRTVDICIEHIRGPQVQLWGDTGFDPDWATGNDAGRQPETARLDGKPLSGDLFVRFPGEPRSVLAEMPSIVERISRYRTFGYAPWITWLLLLGVGIGGPLGLTVAVRHALVTDRPDP